MPALLAGILAEQIPVLQTAGMMGILPLPVIPYRRRVRAWKNLIFWDFYHARHKNVLINTLETRIQNWTGSHCHASGQISFQRSVVSGQWAVVSGQFFRLPPRASSLKPQAYSLQSLLGH